MTETGKLTYHFDWDPVKAKSNLADHKVSFQLAATVFRDPLALTVFDEAHSARMRTAGRHWVRPKTGRTSW